ncbi:MAG TPA: metal-dependent hydrolase [Anaerolineae bacterium]|nr:metal-dependent hydrolase [Anaerolineae bacterium]
MSVVELTYHGHSSFSITVNDTTLLIDPFLSGNPQSDVGPEDVAPDYVLISHGHGDHLGDAVEITKRTGAMTISNNEIKLWLDQQGIEKTHALHIGGGYDFPCGRVKLTIAHHGSMLPDGSYGGAPAGFLLYLEGKKIYHAADTGLFYDMKLIGEEGIDVAILPIGDNFTMGPDDALRAVKLIEPQVVLPIHYDTFDVIRQDPKAFCRRVESETSAKCVILKPGDTYSL